MSWTWQPIGQRRHLVWHGRVACEAIGVPAGDADIPCRECVEAILAIERSAFPK